MKIHPVENELFEVYRWTDMMKLRVTFCNFANALKNQEKLSTKYFY